MKKYIVGLVLVASTVFGSEKPQGHHNEPYSVPASEAIIGNVTVHCFETDAEFEEYDSDELTCEKLLFRYYMLDHVEGDGPACILDVWGDGC